MLKSCILCQKWDKIQQVTGYWKETWQEDAAAQHYHFTSFLFLITFKYYPRNLGQALPHLNEEQFKTGFFTLQSNVGENTTLSDGITDSVSPFFLYFS